jgi:hypothetical protein
MARKTGRAAHVTRSPTVPAEKVLCPSCHRPLRYVRTIIGGVDPIERWDQFTCKRCKAKYEYRPRSRRLRCLG